MLTVSFLCNLWSLFSYSPEPDVEKQAPRQAVNLESSLNAIKTASLHDRQVNAVGSRRRQDSSIITTTDKIVPSLKPLDKEIGQKFIIQILDSINPHRFWFAEYSEFRRLNELITKMTKFYKSHYTDLKINSKQIQKGLHVAVDYSGLWLRSVILKVKSENVVRVFYIDFGTVEDVPLERVCFSLEKFITEPSVTKRGVLGFVQPTGGRWDKAAHKHFARLTRKKAQAELYYKNPHDESYVLSNRVVNNKDLSDEFIEKNYWIADSDFLTKKKVNCSELDFADYEAAMRASNKGKVADWLPKALRGQYSDASREVLEITASSSNTCSSNKENVATDHKRSDSFDATSLSTYVGAPTTASATSSSFLRLSQFMNPAIEPVKAQPITSHNEELQQSGLNLGHKKSHQNGLSSEMASDALNVREPHQIKPIVNVSQQSQWSTKPPPQIHSINGKQSISRVVDLSWDKFQAGSTKSVYCLTINLRSRIFFVLADEAFELRDYFVEFK